MKKLIITGLALLLISGSGGIFQSPLGPQSAGAETQAGPSVQKLETQALQDDVKPYLDLIFALLPTLFEVHPLIPLEIDRVYYWVVRGGGGGCPAVWVDPPVFNGVPTYVIVVADYGTGCEASDGSTVSGSWRMELTNISQTGTHTYLDGLVTFTNLSRNGVLVAHGSVSGSMNVEPFENERKLALTLNTNNLQTTQNGLVKGDLIVEMIRTSIDTPHYHTYILTPTDLTVSFNGSLPDGGHVFNSGSLTLKFRGGTDNFEVTADLATSSGPIQGTVKAESPTAGYHLVNTTGDPFQVGSTIVTLENVVLEPGDCFYPRGGSVNVTKGREDVGVVFHETCDGTYDLQ